MGMMSMRGMVEKAGELSCLAAKGASEGPLIRKIGTGFFFVSAVVQWRLARVSQTFV